jgi:tRNA pseudouridine55 synthase
VIDKPTKLKLPLPGILKAMNGLLLVNKPIGITSFDIIRQLRRVSGVRKIGLAGTLDPLASGLMLLLFGTATKQASTLSGLDKRYEAVITLGAVSTTGDNEGEKTVVSDKDPGLARVQEAVKELQGHLEQTPSVYSAIKINGQEAYKHARAGRSVEMPSRKVTVHEAKMTSYAYPTVEIEYFVSSGTYVRSLAADLGEILGTGAYLSGLVRTQVGKYDLSRALALDEYDSPAAIEQHILEL